MKGASVVLHNCGNLPKEMAGPPSKARHARQRVALSWQADMHLGCYGDLSRQGSPCILVDNGVRGELLNKESMVQYYRSRSYTSSSQRKIITVLF